MYLTTEKARKKWSGAVIGSGARIRSDVMIESGAVIESDVMIESGARIRSDVMIESGAWIESGVMIGSGAVIKSGAVVGSGARIRSGAVIESGAWIESGAVIGSGAVIESGAVVGVVHHKYNGNIIPYKDRIDIRVGCEIHAPEVWKKKGAALARMHRESKWWQDTGKHMLKFLLNEAANYERDYREVNNVQP